MPNMVLFLPKRWVPNICTLPWCSQSNVYLLTTLNGCPPYPVSAGNAFVSSSVSFACMSQNICDGIQLTCASGSVLNYRLLLRLLLLCLCMLHRVPCPTMWLLLRKVALNWQFGITFTHLYHVYFLLFDIFTLLILAKWFFCLQDLHMCFCHLISLFKLHCFL